MKRLKAYLREVIRWIKAGWPLWLMVAAILLTFSGVYSAQCLERGLRLSGLLLQVGGFTLTAYGLQQSRKLFDKPSVHRRIWNYLHRFPLPISRTIHLRPERIELRSLVAGARLSVPPGAGNSTEERLQFLERQYERLSEEFTRVDDGAKERDRKLAGDLEKESSERRKEQQALRDKLDDAVTGGWHVEVMGIVFFLAGIVLASASPEISAVFGKPPSCPTPLVEARVIHWVDEGETTPV